MIGDSVILNTPLIMILLAVALFLSVFNARKRPQTFIIPLFTSMMTVGTITYALILGASMQESLVVLLIFALINLAGFSHGI